MSAILALDQGTTSSRAILFNQAGQIIALAQREVRSMFPQPGWVEQDPDEIWASQHSVALEVLATAGLRPADVVAIGIANQRETTLLWERDTGRPLCNAIVWQDRRTAAHCERLIEDGCEALIRGRTGLVIDPYFSATKLAWLLDNVEGARALAEAGRLAFGTVDAWLMFQLTGQHVTDVTNASRTMLFDIHTGAWDPELLALFNIPASVLPEVAASSGQLGEATAPGLEGIPIAGIAGDQQAALFGQACFDAGMSKTTYGTGCFALLHTGAQARQSQTGLVTTIACDVNGGRHYALEGSVFTAGAAVQWLRDGLGVIRSAGEAEALATSIPDNGGVYLVPAFTGLGAPHWDPHARGVLTGLTQGTTSAHLARAALEAIAYQVADVHDAMHSDSGLDLKELHVDGGAAANDFLMQFQADILGTPVVRPRVTETTALGAAYLAGLATGLWQSIEEIERTVSIERRFEPSMPIERARALRAGWQDAVERAKSRG